jgi:hypothetical protein
MKNIKTVSIILILLLMLGCRVVFSPVLKTSFTVETNVNVNQRVKDSIKKGKHIVEPEKEKSHDKDFE